MLTESAAGIPLYRRVRDILVTRMAEGILKPGQLLPSEFSLAAELDVSQGTVRKALDTLEADNLIIRRQGRGTFVAEQTPEHALYHFFSMVDLTGAAIIPKTLAEEITQRKAPKRVAAALGLDKDAPIVRIRRTRAMNGAPATFEDIFVPRAILPISEDMVLPNALYNHYQVAFGVSVARAEDRLSAVITPKRVARALPQFAGKALLMQQRIAYDLTERAVEMRESFLHTEMSRYAVSLR